jgi:hypothetical protein
VERPLASAYGLCFVRALARVQRRSMGLRGWPDEVQVAKRWACLRVGGVCLIDYCTRTRNCKVKLPPPLRLPINGKRQLVTALSYPGGAVGIRRCAEPPRPTETITFNWLELAWGFRER